MKKIVVMIPARLGSKRIPKKNIRFLGGKPLIQYPIDLINSCSLDCEVWVNTEDVSLGHAVEIMGGKFHHRPHELATDKATNREFTYEFMEKHPCDYVVMINSTSPLLREDTVKSFFSYVDENDYDTVLSVVSEKEETFFDGKPLNFSLEEKVNSQFLKPTQKIVWALTAWKRDNFMRLQEDGKNPVFSGKIALFEIPKDESCDLDTEEDWRIAEGVMMSRKHEFEKAYMELK